MFTLLMLISHVISDFIIQTKEIVNLKSNLKLKGFYYHSLGLMFTSMPILIFIKFEEFKSVILSMVGIIIIHIVLDVVKEKLQKYLKVKKVSVKWYATIFLFDQILHIAVIIMLTHAIVITPNILNNWLVDAVLQGNGLKYEHLKEIFVITYVSFSGAYFIPLVFDIIYEKIYNYEKLLSETLKGEVERKSHAFIDEVKTGKWIGILERILIMIFLFINQFSSIGFIIAIKSLARFKLMENKIFSEYYLLGTLVSVVYTLIGFGVFNYVL